MRMNNEDIRGDILEHWEQITNEYSDLLIELAESAAPIYYNEILKDWADMPQEFENFWRESLPLNDETTLFQLMSIDLYEYYRQTYQEIYLIIKEEKEED